MSNLSTARKIPLEQIREGAKNRALLPTENAFKGKPGYRQKKAKVWRTGVGWVDGYEWSYGFKPNENGKITRAASEVGEMLKPFSRAEVERQAKVQAAIPRVKLSSPNGPQYVEEDRAEAVGRRNGWGRRTGIGWSRAYERGFARIRRREVTDAAQG